MDSITIHHYILTTLLLYVTWKNSRYCARIDASMRSFLKMEIRLNEGIKNIQEIPKIQTDLEFIRSAQSKNTRDIVRLYQEQYPHLVANGEDK